MTMREVPFDITRHEEMKLSSDFAKFQELYKKYNENLEEILEFANLYNKFVVNKGKWE